LPYPNLPFARGGNKLAWQKMQIFQAKSAFFAKISPAAQNGVLVVVVVGVFFQTGHGRMPCSCQNLSKFNLQHFWFWHLEISHVGGTPVLSKPLNSSAPPVGAAALMIISAKYKWQTIPLELPHYGQRK